MKKIIFSIACMFILSGLTYNAMSMDIVRPPQQGSGGNHGGGHHGGGHHGGGNAVGAPLDGGLLLLLGAAGTAYVAARKKKKGSDQ